MSRKICDACETVAHCSKHGCIPITREPIDPYAWIDGLIDRARPIAMVVALLFAAVFAASYLYTK